jgi:hypothetical protein
VLVPYLRTCSADDLENLVKSAQGSKLMQDILKKFANAELVEAIFEIIIVNESKDVLYRLMTNKYANYFTQILVTKATNDHKSKMLRMLLGDYTQINQVFVKSAMNSVGTHCLQALIDQMKTPELIK